MVHCHFVDFGGIAKTLIAVRSYFSAWVKSYQLCFFNFCVLVLMPDDGDDFNVLVLAFVAGFEALLTPNGAVCLERKWTRLVR